MWMFVSIISLMITNGQKSYVVIRIVRRNFGKSNGKCYRIIQVDF